MNAETVTLILVNLAGIMERADESLLPGVYEEVGKALHTDPTGLGSLTLFRSIVQCACYPMAAYLAIRHNRAHVIALGAFLWGATTFLVAFSSTFFQVAVSRALNGIGLALVIPAIQSLVADTTDDSSRGMAFGWLQLTGNLGSIIGGLLSVLIAPITFIGIPGWRIAFHLVGLISVVVGILVYLFAKDPHFSDDNSISCNRVSDRTFWEEVKGLFQEAKLVTKIQSFQIIVAQGVTGSFPSKALSFAPMWLELAGFSHNTTALLVALYVIGASIGGLVAGKLGDTLSLRLPNSGRVMLAQISTASSIPLATLLLLGLPYDPSTVASHALVIFFFGFCKSWDAPAANNPIFAEIVPEKSRTIVYALDRSFESILPSFAPTIVGILSQHVYGYKIPKRISKSEELMTNRENAASLAKALYTVISISLALCCLIYSFLHCTYPRDRAQAQMEALIESEMPKIDPTELHVAEELVKDFERNRDDVDDDKRMLLHHQLPFSNTVE